MKLIETKAGCKIFFVSHCFYDILSVALLLFMLTLLLTLFIYLVYSTDLQIRPLVLVALCLPFDFCE